MMQHIHVQLVSNMRDTIQQYNEYKYFPGDLIIVDVCTVVEEVVIVKVSK